MRLRRYFSPLASRLITLILNPSTLNTQYLHRSPFLGIDVFLLFDGFAQWHIYDLVVLQSYHDIALVFEQSLDSGNTHA